MHQPFHRGIDLNQITTHDALIIIHSSNYFQRADQEVNKQHWHSAIRFYVLAVAGLNLFWEIVQLPLYTIWKTGSTQDIIIAIIHCTAGDVVIAVTALVLALMLLGKSDWPKQRHLSISVLAVCIGLIYTIYSEQLNIANQAWAYSDLMPIIPWLEVGITPILQWILIPSFCFWKLQKPTN